MRHKAFAAALAFASAGALAQLLVPVDPDWKEVEAPRPPAVATSGLVMLDVPGSSLKFGVDPASITIGPDRVVRYVLVASSASGVVNAFYEGVRCNSGDVKVYARHDPGKGWVPTPEAEWTALQEGRHARTSLQVARLGACVGNAPNSSPRDIARDLRSSPEHRFERAVN
jgi:hypothetical protein